MATPSCPKCGSTSFEIKAFEIRDAQFAHNAICCATCGCIVSTEEHYSAMYMLQQIMKKFGIPLQ